MVVIIIIIIITTTTTTTSSNYNNNNKIIPPGKFGSSSSLWNSATKTCFNNSSADGLLSGLKWRQAWRTSNPSGDADGNVSGIVLCTITGNVSSNVAAKGEATTSISAFEGICVTCITRSIWFIVDVPGKTGRPFSISPTDVSKVCEGSG